MELNRRQILELAGLDRTAPAIDLYVGFAQDRLHLFKASDGTALHAPHREERS